MFKSEDLRIDKAVGWHPTAFSQSRAAGSRTVTSSRIRAHSHSLVLERLLRTGNERDGLTQESLEVHEHTSLFSASFKLHFLAVLQNNLRYELPTNEYKLNKNVTPSEIFFVYENK